jgi:O-antigen/teichoic acid export membrane protein
VLSLFVKTKYLLKVVLSKKLFRNGLTYFVTSVVNNGIPFILLPILTRLLSTADYGILGIFLLLVTTLSSFSGLSVNGAIGLKYFQLDKLNFSDYVSSCIAILATNITLLFLVAIIFGDFLSEIAGISKDWIFLAIFISGLQFLITIRLTILQAGSNAYSYGALQIFQGLVSIFIALILIKSFKFGWEGRAIGLLVATLACTIISIWGLVKNNLIKIPKNLRLHTHDALSFGIPLVPHVFGGILVSVIDKLVIVKILGTGQVGVYIACLQVGQIIGLIVESFNKAFAPWITEKLSSGSIDKYKVVKFTYLYLGAIFTLALMLSLIAQHVLNVLVGEEFRGGKTVVVFTAFGYAFVGCYTMVVNYVFFARKTGSLACITLISGLINIPITIYLVELIGINGAALAFMLTNLLAFLGVWWLSQKSYPMPWFDFGKKIR